MESRIIVPAVLSHHPTVSESSMIRISACRPTQRPRSYQGPHPIVDSSIPCFGLKSRCLHLRHVFAGKTISRVFAARDPDAACNLPSMPRLSKYHSESPLTGSVSVDLTFQKPTSKSMTWKDEVKAAGIRCEQESGATCLQTDVASSSELQ